MTKLSRLLLLNQFYGISVSRTPFCSRTITNHVPGSMVQIPSKEPWCLVYIIHSCIRTSTCVQQPQSRRNNSPGGSNSFKRTHLKFATRKLKRSFLAGSKSFKWTSLMVQVHQKNGDPFLGSRLVQANLLGAQSNSSIQINSSKYYHNKQ